VYNDINSVFVIRDGEVVLLPSEDCPTHCFSARHPRTHFPIGSMIKFDNFSTPVVVFKTVISADHGALGILRTLAARVPVYAVASDREHRHSIPGIAGKIRLDIDTTPEEKCLQFLLTSAKNWGPPDTDPYR